MASAEQMREWAQGQGIDIGTKGRIPAAVREAYTVAHPGETTTSPTSTIPDYPEGMTEDDFSGPAGPPPADDLAEDKPGPVATTARARRSFPGLPKPKTKIKGKPKHRGPRVPVDEAIATVWSTAANLAKPIPPLARTLQFQAPVAGLLLEDEIKGTVADRVLQPLARWQSHGDAVIALAGPPVLVTALSLHVQRAQLEGGEPNPVFMALAGAALRQSLMTMMRVGGPKFEVAAKREAQLEEDFGQGVDDLMALLLYGTAEVGPAGDGEAAPSEEEAIRRAQGMM